MRRSWKKLRLEIELPQYQVDFLRLKVETFEDMPGIRRRQGRETVQVTFSALISGLIEAWMALSFEGKLQQKKRETEDDGLAEDP